MDEGQRGVAQSGRGPANSLLFRGREPAIDQGLKSVPERVAQDADRACSNLLGLSTDLAGCGVGFPWRDHHIGKRGLYGRATGHPRRIPD
eukprot:1729396-Lingulodinium_polyedra.AAC.1